MTTSVGLQGRGRVSISGGITGSTSNMLFLFTPAAPYGYLTATSITTQNGIYTMGSALNQYSGFSVLSSSCSAYRVVSFGLVIRVVSNVTNTQGALTISTIGMNRTINWSGATTIQAISPDYQEQEIVPLATGMEYTWISKPLGTTAHQPDSLSATNTSTVTFPGSCPQWTQCVVEVSGGVAATALEVEYFLNVEAQVSPQNALQHFCPATAPPNPIATNLRAKVHASTSSTLSGGIQAAENWFTSKLSSLAGDLVRDVNPEMIMSSLVGLL
jgi:hypothetical protein